MYRLYKENIEFNEYSIFDTGNGQLITINEFEYKKYRDSSENIEVFESNSDSNRTRFPRRIYFQITHQCNLQCTYCFIKANKMASHLDFNVIKNIAKFTGKQGLMEVRLSGGEPTLHPYFTSIFNEFRKNNVYVSIATNCIWSDSIKRFLHAKNDLWIIASLDGDKVSHDKNRNNSYSTALNNLFELREKNKSARIRLNMVLTKDSFGKIENISKIANKLSAENISLLPLRPEVRDDNMLTKMLNASEFKYVIKEMIKLKKKYNINFTTALPTEFFEDISKDKIFTKRISCAAGREGTNLDFNPNKNELLLYGCSTCPASDISAPESIKEPFLAGKFDYKDIEMIMKIWEDDSRWQIFRDNSIKSYKCKSCDELGKRCTGSCPIQNINWKEINMKRKVSTQIFNQIKNSTEWYCYKYIE